MLTWKHAQDSFSGGSGLVQVWLTTGSRLCHTGLKPLAALSPTSTKSTFHQGAREGTQNSGLVQGWFATGALVAVKGAEACSPGTTPTTGSLVVHEWFRSGSGLGQDWCHTGLKPLAARPSPPRPITISPGCQGCKLQGCFRTGSGLALWWFRTGARRIGGTRVRVGNRWRLARRCKIHCLFSKARAATTAGRFESLLAMVNTRAHSFFPPLAQAWENTTWCAENVSTSDQSLP